MDNPGSDGITIEILPLYDAIINDLSAIWNNFSGTLHVHADGHGLLTEYSVLTETETI